MPISEKKNRKKTILFGKTKYLEHFFIILIAPLQSIKQITENEIIFIHFLRTK